MKALMSLEMRRRWKSPGTWLFLAVSLMAAGAGLIYNNLLGGAPAFTIAFQWAYIALIPACPLLTWGAYSCDRRNDAWKYLFSRRVSPFAAAFSRLLSAWSVCAACAVFILTGPLTMYFTVGGELPAALASAGAWLAQAWLMSGFCLWLESCARRAWRSALASAIALAGVYWMPQIRNLLLAGGARAAGAALAISGGAFAVSFLAAGHLRVSLILSAAAAAIMALPREWTAWLISRLAVFERMQMFIVGICDLSALLICAAGGCLFAAFAAACMMRQRGEGRLPAFSRSHRTEAAAMALFVAVAMGLPHMGPSLTRMDATWVRAITPAAEAEEILAESEMPIHAYYVSSDTDIWVESLLERYEILNDRFTFSRVDLTSDPEFADAYYGAQDQDGCIILEGGGRYAVIPQEAVYVYDYTYDMESGKYVPTGLSFGAQEQLLKGIRFLSEPDVPEIYALIGHYEALLGDYARQAVYENGIFLGELRLTQDPIPESCACIVIHDPQVDISEEERDALITYLRDGGGLILTTNYQTGDMPNLYQVMDYCGMARRGVLAMECSQGLYIDGYPYYPAPRALSHGSTVYVMGNQVVVPTAHGIISSAQQREGLIRTPLLMTSEMSYLKNSARASTLDMEEGDLSGPAVLAMASEDGAMRCVWVAGSEYMNNSMAMISSSVNIYFWLGQVEWTAGGSGTPPYAEVESPSLTTYRIGFTSPQRTLILAVVCIPAAASAVAAAILGMRRRKRRRA